jgi:hypothetical protein
MEHDALVRKERSMHSADRLEHDALTRRDAGREHHDVAADAQAIVGLNGDDHTPRTQNARIERLAEAMEGRSEADQLALLQEVMRQDPGATNTWLSLHRIDTLQHPEDYRNERGVPRQGASIDPQLLEAVAENLLFTPQGMGQFVQGNVTRNLESYQEHSRDLRWFIANHGVAMTPAGLQGAISEFRDGRGEEWNRNLDQSEGRVRADGQRILNALSDPRMQSLSEEQRRAIMHTLVEPEHPAATAALAMSFNQESGVEPRLLDGAMTFFAETGLRQECPQLATTVADARVQQVSRAIERVNPNDPRTVDAARAEIDRLRESEYASLRGIGTEQAAQLERTVDALRDTVRPGASAASIQASIDIFASRANSLDNSSNGNVTEGLRLLALQSGSVSATDERGHPNDELVAEISGRVGLANVTLDLLEHMGMLAGNRLVGAITGPAVGGVLAGISYIQTLQYLGQGDYANAALSGIGTGAGVVGLLATSTAVTAACAGIGLAVALAAYGLASWRTVQASNRYMNEEGRTFLEHSGLSSSTAGVLTDQSGEGYSPVPLFFAYAESRGMDLQETVQWLNQIPTDTLRFARDLVHHRLDEVDGDLAQVEENFGDFERLLQQLGVTTPCV